MNLLSTEHCKASIIAMAQAIRQHRDELSALDAALGDGDHGFNMDAAMQAAVAAIHHKAFETPAQLLMMVGNTLINEMGGASGIIFGSFFSGGGRAVKGRPALGLADLIAFFEHGTAKVQKRGKAKAGDKTVVDVLIPALAALQTAHDEEATITGAVQAAADAAQTGARSTKEMVAKHGRAKFLGERSVGHQDAGATSMALMLAAWAQTLK